VHPCADMAGRFPLMAEKRASRIGEIHEPRRDRPPVQGAPFGQASLSATTRAVGGSRPFPVPSIFGVGTFRLNTTRGTVVQAYAPADLTPR